MNKKAMEKALAAFMKNPFWREYLETAPSEQCKEYIKLEFYYSDLTIAGSDERDEVAKAMQQYESQFSVLDWKHLQKYAGNNPFWIKCKQKVEELSSVRGSENVLYQIKPQ